MILIGFSFGYIYNNYSNQVCRETPFAYAIEKINDMNNDNFICLCLTGSTILPNVFLRYCAN